MLANLYYNFGCLVHIIIIIVLVIAVIFAAVKLCKVRKRLEQLNEQRVEKNCAEEE